MTNANTSTRIQLPEATRYENVSFSVSRRFSNLSFSPGSGWVVINYDTAPINDVGAFNVGTGEYTCPKAGIMCFSANTIIRNNSGSANPFVAFRIVAAPSTFKNNVAFIGQKSMNAGVTEVVSSSALTQVEVGTIVRLELFVNNTTLDFPVTLYGEDSCLFSGYYLT
jgi:C1q domain